MQDKVRSLAFCPWLVDETQQSLLPRMPACVLCETHPHFTPWASRTVWPWQQLLLLHLLFKFVIGVKTEAWREKQASFWTFGINKWAFIWLATTSESSLTTSSRNKEVPEWSSMLFLVHNVWAFWANCPTPLHRGVLSQLDSSDKFIHTETDGVTIGGEFKFDSLMEHHQS